MEQMTNTLLPARMFVVCSAVSYGNKFQSAKAKSKFLPFDYAQDRLFFSKFLLCGIGSCMQCYGMERHTAGDGDLNLQLNFISKKMNEIIRTLLL